MIRWIDFGNGFFFFFLGSCGESFGFDFFCFVMLLFGKLTKAEILDFCCC